MAYTDLLNVTIDNLATKLATISGLKVVTDPRNIQPPCVFLDAPSFDAWNYNIVKMSFPCRLISMGPSNLDALRVCLNMAANILTANLGVTDGRPSSVTIGGVEYPSFDININIQGQAN